MAKDDIQQLALRLHAARRDRVPIEPVAEAVGSVERAYDIQLQTVKLWRSEGRAIGGYKIGLTSAAMQKQLGVDQPDFGHLFADDFVLSGEPIDASRFLQPRIEPEIAFVLKRDLAGPGVTVADALGAIDYAVAAFEIIDSRIRDWRISLLDTVADNASAGGLILGSTPLDPRDADLRLLGVNLRSSGQLVRTGAGGAALGSPVTTLVWLANTLGALGTPMAAGSTVLTGSLTAAVPVAAGDVVTAEFARLGTITATFAAPPPPSESGGPTA